MTGSLCLVTTKTDKKKPRGGPGGNTQEEEKWWRTTTDIISCKPPKSNPLPAVLDPEPVGYLPLVGFCYLVHLTDKFCYVYSRHKDRATSKEFPPID